MLLLSLSRYQRPSLYFFFFSSVLISIFNFTSTVASASLSISSTSSSVSHSDVVVQMDPVANPAAIVIVNNARFSMLTPHIIRMEWSPTKSWQDSATWAFNYRNQPVPNFNVSKNSTHTLIRTDYVYVEYLTAATTTFNSSNIKVTAYFDETSVSWSAINHEEYEGRMFGTVRTLDGTAGEKDIELDCRYNQRPDLHCTYGVISRNGYALIDDTNQPFFDNSSWPWLVPVTYPAASMCTIDDNDKRDCASYPSIDKNTCIAIGCCWGASEKNVSNTQIDGTPFCYYSVDARQDFYFLGHGLDYKKAVKEFATLSGPVPLPPRYAFGIFFSRWWAYASYEEKEIITQFYQHDVPIDTLVTDMDWHITFYKEAAAGEKDQAGQSIGWTGFTFENKLFDNPAAYLAWCKLFGLHNTMNLHPASGVQPWEQSYVAVATAMGIDPDSKKYVPLNMTDPKFMNNWFNLTLAPLEEIGIDLWWLDWQQGENWIDQVNVNPTWWLNYLFFTNPYHWQQTKKRPAFLHRFGGLGNHRYQVGFSGDVETSYDSLSFQPYFTASASNALWQFWSHDLGSLVLFLILSYTLAGSNGERSHQFSVPIVQKMLTMFIWEFPWSYYVTLRKYFKLRQALIPYIYTQARRSHDEALGIVLPLYYEWPYHNESYTYNHEYTFGRSFLLAPVTQPSINTTGLAETTMWIPEGNWVNIITGSVLTGPQIYTHNWTLSEMPAFVRAGSIIPMLPDSVPPIGQSKKMPDTIKLFTVVGGRLNGSGILYEDAGDSPDYKSPNTYSFTDFGYQVGGSNNDSVKFVIMSPNGSYETQPSARSYEIHLFGILPAQSVSLTIATGNNCDSPSVDLPYMPFLGIPISAGGGMISQTNYYSYDGATLSVIVYLNDPIPIQSEITVNVILYQGVNNLSPIILDGFPGILTRFIAAKVALDNEWGGCCTVYMDDYPNLLQVAQLGEVFTNNPAGVSNLLMKPVQTLISAACNEVNGGISKLSPELQFLLAAQLCFGE